MDPIDDEDAGRGVAGGSSAARGRMGVLAPGSALVAGMAQRRARQPSARRTARGPTQRADRLHGHSVQHKALPSKGSLSKLVAAATAMEDEMEEDEEEEKVVDKKRVEALQERRCDSRGRGGVYDPVLGICYHFCRQKKLCGEEDCKRCGEGDLKQPWPRLGQLRTKALSLEANFLPTQLWRESCP